MSIVLPDGSPAPGNEDQQRPGLVRIKQTIVPPGSIVMMKVLCDDKRVRGTVIQQVGAQFAQQGILALFFPPQVEWEAVIAGEEIIDKLRRRILADASAAQGDEGRGEGEGGDPVVGERGEPDGPDSPGPSQREVSEGEPPV